MLKTSDLNQRPGTKPAAPAPGDAEQIADLRTAIAQLATAMGEMAKAITAIAQQISTRDQ